MGFVECKLLSSFHTKLCGEWTNFEWCRGGKGLVDCTFADRVVVFICSCSFVTSFLFFYKLTHGNPYLTLFPLTVYSNSSSLRRPSFLLCFSIGSFEVLSKKKSLFIGSTVAILQTQLHAAQVALKHHGVDNISQTADRSLSSGLLESL